MRLQNICCDYKGCKHLTNKICRLEDLPESMLGKISPSYPVYVKICGAHNVKVVVESLDFVIDNKHNWPGWAPYSYRCIRCDHIWESKYLKLGVENFGKLPATCPKCFNIYWYKEPRFKRGKFIETKVYHKVVVK